MRWFYCLSTRLAVDFGHQDGSNASRRPNWKKTAAETEDRIGGCKVFQSPLRPMAKKKMDPSLLRHYPLQLLEPVLHQDQVRSWAVRLFCLTTRDDDEPTIAGNVVRTKADRLREH